MALRILVVEDNLDWEVIWKLIVDVLTEGAELSWATSVVDAEKQINAFEAKGARFDIIVSDIFLSGSFTGFDLYNHLNDHYKKRFLFVSSVTPHKVRALLKSSGPEIHVLQK